MSKQQFPATGEALSPVRLATITSLKDPLVTAKSEQFIGSAEGSIKWRRNLESLNKGRS